VQEYFKGDCMSYIVEEKEWGKLCTWIREDDIQHITYFFEINNIKLAYKIDSIEEYINGTGLEETTITITIVDDNSITKSNINKHVLVFINGKYDQIMHLRLTHFSSIGNINNVYLSKELANKIYKYYVDKDFDKIIETMDEYNNSYK
jgi:hypothetical protein